MFHGRGEREVVRQRVPLPEADEVIRVQRPDAGHGVVPLAAHEVVHEPAVGRHHDTPGAVVAKLVIGRRNDFPLPARGGHAPVGLGSGEAAVPLDDPGRPVAVPAVAALRAEHPVARLPDDVISKDRRVLGEPACLEEARHFGLVEADGRRAVEEPVHAHPMGPAATEEVEQVRQALQVAERDAHHIDPQLVHEPKVALNFLGVVGARVEPAEPVGRRLQSRHVQGPVVDPHRVPGLPFDEKVAVLHRDEFTRLGRCGVEQPLRMHDAVDDLAAHGQLGDDPALAHVAANPGALHHGPGLSGMQGHVVLRLEHVREIARHMDREMQRRFDRLAPPVQGGRTELHFFPAPHREPPGPALGEEDALADAADRVDHGTSPGVGGERFQVTHAERGEDRRAERLSLVQEQPGRRATPLAGCVTRLQQGDPAPPAIVAEPSPRRPRDRRQAGHGGGAEVAVDDGLVRGRDDRRRVLQGIGLVGRVKRLERRERLARARSQVRERVDRRTDPVDPEGVRPAGERGGVAAGEAQHHPHGVARAEPVVRAAATAARRRVGPEREVVGGEHVVAPLCRERNHGHPPRAVGLADFHDHLRRRLVAPRPEAEQVVTGREQAGSFRRGMGAPAVEAIGPHPGSMARAVGPPRDDLEAALCLCVARRSRPTRRAVFEVEDDPVFGDPRPPLTDHPPVEPLALPRPHQSRERRSSQRQQVSPVAQVREQRSHTGRRIDRSVGQHDEEEPLREQHARIDRLRARHERDAKPGFPKRGGQHVDRRVVGIREAIADHRDRAAGPGLHIQAGECGHVLVRNHGGRSGRRARHHSE